MPHPSVAKSPSAVREVPQGPEVNPQPDRPEVPSPTGPSTPPQIPEEAPATPPPPEVPAPTAPDEQRSPEMPPGRPIDGGAVAIWHRYGD